MRREFGWFSESIELTRVTVPSERKTGQARILAYAQEIRWRFVPRAEINARRGFDFDGAAPENRTLATSLHFGNMPHQLIPAQIQVHDIDLTDLEDLKGTEL